MDLQVSLQHTENIGANTEFEYLKNIMFQVSGLFLDFFLFCFRYDL